ncbi:MAG: thiolase family protein, partial [Thermoleophilia bacterium]|nr:thiolase family protein [Thermoleophilia bacterium]
APRLPASVLLSAGEGRPLAVARAAGLAYFGAGLGPEDLDLAEVEDATPAAEISAYEALELAPAQRGPELVETGFTELGGVVPVNVSGATLAQGRVPGSGAILQLIELAQQLRGRAGRRQVPGARVGLALCGDAIGPQASTSLTIVGP